MPPSTRKSDCPQYGTSVASSVLTMTAFPGHAGRRVVARFRSGTSSIDVPENEVEAGEDRDDVGDVDAAEHPRRDRDVVEARRSDLDAEGAEVALAEDVVAHLAERV